MSRGLLNNLKETGGGTKGCRQHGPVDPFTARLCQISGLKTPANSVFFRVLLPVPFDESPFMCKYAKKALGCQISLLLVMFK